MNTVNIKKSTSYLKIFDSDYCNGHLFLFYSSGRASPSETKSEKSSVTQMTSFSGGTGGSTLGAKLSHDQSLRYVRSPDAFVSIQLEKVSAKGCHKHNKSVEINI